MLDEVQTGMFRTGPFRSRIISNGSPTLVILTKALSGGLVQSGAVLISNSFYD